MQVIIFFILCVFVIILSVQARSIEPPEVDVESKMFKKEDFDREYSKLLAYLTNHKTNRRHNNNDDDDSSSSSSKVNKQLPKRGFFLFPDRRSNQRYRAPVYSYGRKSHWDTFFG